MRPPLASLLFPTVVLCSAEPATEVDVVHCAIGGTDGAAPDEIMLLPPGASIATRDGRGPWKVPNAAALAARSIEDAGGRLPIDENHATDLAQPRGAPSPARGWITAIEARADGVWGKVEWSATGKQLLAERAYRFISPVLQVLKDGTVVSILRASLVNTPNLRGMAALNATEINMDLLAQLRSVLGLKDDADAAAVIAKVKALCGGGTSMQAQLAPIAKAAGLKDDADATAVLNAVTALADAAAKAVKPEQLTALQTELRDVTTRLNAVLADTAKKAATEFVDAAIKAGRVGVKGLRDHYIARHALNAESAKAVETEINALPILTGRQLPAAPSKDKDGKVLLNAEDPDALAGAAVKYRDEQSKLGRNITIAEAVHHVKENLS